MPVEELTTRPFVEFIHPDDLQATHDEVEKASEDGPARLQLPEPLPARGRLVPLVGMDVPAGLRVQLMFAVARLRVQLMFAVARDVTQRKEAEGWQLATHMRTDLVMDALGMANGLRRPDSEGPSVHATAVRS